MRRRRCASACAVTPTTCSFSCCRQHATVVVGGAAGTWRASREERLARRLTHLGHRVVFAPIEERPSDEVADQPGLPTYGMFDVRSMGHFVVLVAVLALGMAPRAALAQAPTNQELLQRIAALEVTLTYEYKVADGFLARGAW